MSAALKLELFQNGALLQEVPVGSDVLWIGRGEDCAIRLEDRAISRKHVCLKPVANGLEFEKKSKFGEIRMGGREVEHLTLKGGECLVLGPYEIRVVRQGPEMNPPAAEEGGSAESRVPEASLDSVSVSEPVGFSPSESALEVPMEVAPAENALLSHSGADSEALVVEAEAALAVEDAPEDAPAEEGGIDFGFGAVEENGQTRAMTDARIETKPILEFHHADGASAYDIVDAEIAIGRSQNCHVVLEDKKSSRKHAIILQKDGRFLLRDLGSSNGTLVNGERVDEHELSSGDEIQIGDTRFTFKKVQGDYEAKKAEFLRLPEEMPPPPSVPEYAAPMEPLMADPVMFEAAPEDPPLPDFTTTEPEQKSLIGAFLDRYRTMPLKMQVIYGVLILAGVWLFLDDSELETKPVLQMGQTQKSVAKKDEKKTAGAVGQTFESLTPEQQAYVESEYKIAYDYFRNHEYDLALLELGKIFALVQNYNHAREIESFAREKKRQLERQEEERKRQEQERQAQIRLQSLIDQAGLLMDARKYKDAEALFPEIELLQPENSFVANWRKRIIEENENFERQEKERARIAELRKKAWEDYRKAESRLKAGDFFGALDQYDALAVREGLEKELSERIKNDIRTAEDSIAAKRDPLIAHGQELEKALNFSEAYKAYAMAAQVDPTDETAPAGMERIRGVLTSKAKAVYSEGVIAESFSEFEVAEKKYREVLEIVPPEHDYFSKATRRIKRILSARKPASEGGPQ